MALTNDWWNYAHFTPEEKRAFVRAEVARKKEQFNRKPDGLTDEVRKEFAQLASQLSPENLHEDGEISAARAQMKYIRIMKRWRELERMAGRTISESEAGTFSID